MNTLPNEAPGRQELPAWAETVRQKYLAGEASVFVLYGNVFDRTLIGDKPYACLLYTSRCV